MVFTDQKLCFIIKQLKEQLKVLPERGIISFLVISPDLNPQLFNGESIELNGIRYLHHSLKCWQDLAESLNCRMLVPIKTENDLLQICYQKLADRGWHKNKIIDSTEKYGDRSDFFRIDKSEEAAFYADFTASLANCNLPPDCRVLNLGCHRGTEFELLHNFNPELLNYSNFTGIDHSSSAIRQAKQDYPQCNLICGDINLLDRQLAGRFDLIISIGTLQSPGINAKKLFMQLVQDYLAPAGSIIIGQPNCRYIESEIKYGAVTKNRQDGEMGLAINDLFFYKKYLQQHKFETFLRGKYYLFLTGQCKL